MKNLQITKKLRAFWRSTMYACSIGLVIVSMNGCNNLKDEPIIPQNNAIQALAKEYNLNKVAKPVNNQKVIYLKGTEKASAFFGIGN